MNQFVPIEKQSKKKQKTYYAKQRNDWGTFNPVTRSVPNGRSYNRKKQKSLDRRSGRLSHYGEGNCRFYIIWEKTPTSK